MVDNVTIYGIATLVAGVLGICIRYTFKSKCSDVGLCCGLVHIERDIEMEVKAEQAELDAGVKPEDSQRI
jgi:hypothetical protein